MGTAMGRLGAKLLLPVLGIALLSAMPGCGSGGPSKKHLTITITSSPEDGAEAMVSGETVGLTPCTATVEPGYNDVLLRKDRYKLTTQRIEVRPDGPLEFAIDMQPLVGYVTIESDPTGAKVLMDGDAWGTTPIYSREVPVGEHSFDLQVANHVGVQDSFNVEEDFKYTKKYVLTPMESTLAITSRPSGASIYINNEKQKETTPAKFTLIPGEYVVSVYTEGYVQKEEKVALAPNEDRQLSLIMVEGNAPPGMVLVPAGEFIFGADQRAPDEAPQSVINLPAFYIDKTEVTNAQYKAVFPDHEFAKGQEDMPVTNVSWNEAMKFASLVGKRLPTEREWEKAARGVHGLEYPWGQDYDSKFCNGLESGKEAPVRVSQYISGMSPYGCMDMAGNVAEWVQDWYEAYPGNKQITKEYGQVYRVLRGGAYDSERFELRCARRRFDKMDAKKPMYGFRCAKDVTN
jgi:formylglycine-generating enzyme required for sulfatase activity